RVMKRGAELDEAVANNADSDSLADLGLRFDLTVPLTRVYATNRSSLPTVFKAIQIGPVWRAERPQKGRYRQFVQCDIDIIGDAGVLAEIELLTASLAALDALGLSNAVIRVNHRELLVELLAGFGVKENQLAQAMIIIDKLDKIEITGVVEELTEKLGSEIAEAAKNWFANLDASVIPAVLKELFDVVGADRLKFDPTLVRGMGYYTGVIFEIELPGTGSSIGGGGRYDGMVGKWLGSDVPAVGISLGFERVIDLIEETQSSQGVVLVLEDDSAIVLKNALQYQRELIDQGLNVRLELKPKRLNLLLENMKANGFDRFALVSANATQELKSID
ncbi:MAG: ATP phosphoribosyltransferase regulatory subunit, partial [Rhodoluna sp.]